MSHLNNTRRANPGMSLSQAMKKASGTYRKKSRRRQRGGGQNNSAEVGIIALEKQNHF